LNDAAAWAKPPYQQRGEYTLSVDALSRIAKGLGVRVRDLVANI